MMSVFISGVVGFFCYEILRLGKVYYDNKVVELCYGGVPGIILRVLLHCVAGVVGIFASLDVVVKFGHYSSFAPELELIGSYLRAFAIGFGGPAGISKWDSGAGIIKATGRANDGALGKPLDTLETGLGRHHSTIYNEVVFAARRTFLR